MLRTIISIWRDFSSQMKKQNISAYASSTAFFLFLSVIPMLMVVCAVIPYTPVTEQNLVTALTDVTPDIADAMVESLVVDVYESSVGILPVALIAMVWSAAKGVMALMRGLNAVNGVDEIIAEVETNQENLRDPFYCKLLYVDHACSVDFVTVFHGIW